MMNRIEFDCSKIEGIRIIKPYYQEDERGYFLKYLERDSYLAAGLQADVQECFESYSRNRVVRGLHFQTKAPQIKIIRAIKGTIRDVAVDLRKGSETFGQYICCELSSENRNSLWIPAGFAHGYQVLSEDAIVSYVGIGRYLSEYDSGIRWNDPELAIPWDFPEAVISLRDNGLQSFADFRKSIGGL